MGRVLLPRVTGRYPSGYRESEFGSNTTLVAVALKYDQKEMASPVVLAKGYDEIAQKIKAVAAEHNIPMVENI